MLIVDWIRCGFCKLFEIGSILSGPQYSQINSGEFRTCSEEKIIRGPVALSKVEKNIRNILAKLMPGESYKLSDKSGSISLVTLCERFINEKKSGSLSFENMKKNEEALRLSNALMLELRRNTTVVKKWQKTV